jgi:very-short-patch-repair endonuclease
MSLPEVLLWRALRGGALERLRFRRQHPLGPYVLDFYCAEARLAVEVDGLAHSLGDGPARDARRDLWLADHGVRVLRLAASRVLEDLAPVLVEIAAAARTPPEPPPPRSAVPLPRADAQGRI